jgi:hypothetical protein
MKNTILVFIILALTQAVAYGQTKKEEQQYIVSILKKHAPFKETNPVHQEEADEVNSIFMQAINGLNIQSEEDKSNLRTKALLMLYDNSVAIFEDATDVRRMATRRCLCFMTLSLLSDEWRFLSFINDAINTVSDILPEEQYQRKALIHLLEILLKYPFENKNEIERKYKCLHDFFISNRDYFDKNFADDFIQLMQKVKVKNQ